MRSGDSRNKLRVNGKRLGVDQRLSLDRKIGLALALLALMFVATLLDFGAGLWGIGGNNLFAFQAPLLLRRVSFSVFLDHVGMLRAPLGSALAVLVLLAWIGVGLRMRLRDVRAFAIGVSALLFDSCFLWLSMRAGRASNVWACRGLSCSEWLFWSAGFVFGTHSSVLAIGPARSRAHGTSTRSGSSDTSGSPSGTICRGQTPRPGRSDTARGYSHNLECR